MNETSDGGLFKLWVLVFIGKVAGWANQRLMDGGQSEAGICVSDQSEARTSWSELRTCGTE